MLFQCFWWPSSYMRRVPSSPASHPTPLTPDEAGQEYEGQASRRRFDATWSTMTSRRMRLGFYVTSVQTNLSDVDETL